MASTAAINRPPPAHPGPNGGNPHSQPNSSVPNSGPQDPALHGTSQDPGPSSHSQHPVSARPVFYIPAPPPLPFLQYQWPMPFSYNPFSVFPGMGYGMIMPPFPPPPYMEAPAYILPHSHIQPVDYRRLLHPQVHTPSVPYQNPNQTRRIRLPHIVPIKETVNSAVQTEPTQTGVGSDGSPPIRPDSGHGTTSNSPASSSSSSQQRSSAKVKNYTLPSNNAQDLQVNMTCTNGIVKHGFNIQHPTGTKTVQTCIRATVETHKCHEDSADQKNVPPYRNSDYNIWSVGSPDSMVPVCSSSQQEDEFVKERRISVPDILINWGGGVPQATMLKMADKVPPQNDRQLPAYKTEVEREKSVYHRPIEPTNGPVVADSAEAEGDAENILNFKDRETIFKILKLPFALHDLHSESRRGNEPVGLVGCVNNACKVPENGEETNPHEDTTDIIPCQMFLNSSQMKRKMNDSVWSVESLAPFIPTKELLLHQGMFEPDIIIEMTEEAENCRLSTHNDKLIVKSRKKRRQSRRFSSCDSIPMSDSWLSFSTPAKNLNPSNQAEMENESDTSEMGGPKQCPSIAPLEEDPLVSLTHLQSEIILSSPTEEKKRSSEPEANQSPNQDSLIENEQQKVSPCSPEEEETPLNSVAEEKISPTGQLILPNEEGVEHEDRTCHLRSEQLCVLRADQRMSEVSPTKGHFVDCGVQCTVIQELENSCEDLNIGTGPRRWHPFSENKEANGGQAEGFHSNGHMWKNQDRHGQRRNRGQGNAEKDSSQQGALNGYYGKPGKSRGRNGRNSRH